MAKQQQSTWQRLQRSGLGTAVGLLVVLAVIALGWEAHLRGKFHRMTTEDPTDHSTVEVRPGGQALVRITRTVMPASMAPEFTEVTVAPGVGMLMLEALLQPPGHAEEPVLEGTPEASIASAGVHLQGAAVHATVASLEGTRWTPPVELVAGLPSAQESTQYLPGGNRCEAVFSGDATLPSGALVHTGVETNVAVVTTLRGIEVSISARNKSTGKRQVVLDWQPRFLAPEAGAPALTYLPPRQADSSSAPAEQQVGSQPLNRTVASLQHSYLGGGPEFVLHNRAKGYALRMTALTPAMRSVHVQSAGAGTPLLVAFSTAEGATPDKAPTLLMPGEKLEWHLRIEALSETASAGNP